MGGPDAEEWTPRDWAEQNFDDYGLETYERDSLDQISRNLLSRSYTDADSCFAHMQLLEHLSNRLHGIMAGEAELGKDNLDIQEAFRDIREMHRQLTIVHTGLRKKR
jgi:hypothetical protein